MQYMGCYKSREGRYDQLQKMMPETSEGNSPSNCGKACQNSGYKYFGVHNGNMCGCSHRPRHMNEMPDDRCNMKCSGDDSKMCGSSSLNSLYEWVDKGTTQTNPPTTTTTTTTATTSALTGKENFKVLKRFIATSLFMK